jgi:hypothetical protein
MEDVGAKPSLYGTVLLTIIENGQQTEFELPIDLAQKLRSQLEASVITARLRISARNAGPRE